MTDQQLARVRDTIEQIRSDSFRVQLEQALPPGVSVRRFVQVTATAIQQNPDIVKGDRSSLYRSVVRCAQDGLLPDGREAALVMFKGTVQYLPMVGGLRKIADKHGLALTAYVVYADDEFAYQLGVNPTLTHTPAPLGQERGKPIGAYAVARDEHGRVFLEVMSLAEIDKVRSVSRARSGPWDDWWDEMARKTVARRLFKQLPIGDITDHEQRVLTGDDLTVSDGGVMDPDDAAIVRGIGPAFVDDESPEDFPIPEQAQAELDTTTENEQGET